MLTFNSVLDIDCGTYPFVTSHTGLGGCIQGLALSLFAIKCVYFLPLILLRRRRNYLAAHAAYLEELYLLYSYRNVIVVVKAYVSLYPILPSSAYSCLMS